MARGKQISADLRQAIMNLLQYYNCRDVAERTGVPLSSVYMIASDTVIGESECVWSVYAQKSIGESHRDASFARVSLIYDVWHGLILNDISSIL